MHPRVSSHQPADVVQAPTLLIFVGDTDVYPGGYVAITPPKIRDRQFHFFDGLSAVLPGEFQHEIAEGFDAFGWHGVVDRGAAAADGAVAF